MRHLLRFGFFHVLAGCDLCSYQCINGINNPVTRIRRRTIPYTNITLCGLIRKQRPSHICRRIKRLTVRINMVVSTAAQCWRIPCVTHCGDVCTLVCGVGKFFQRTQQYRISNSLSVARAHHWASCGSGVYQHGTIHKDGRRPR